MIITGYTSQNLLEFAKLESVLFKTLPFKARSRSPIHEQYLKYIRNYIKNLYGFLVHVWKINIDAKVLALN